MDDIISVISQFSGSWLLADIAVNFKGSLFEKFKGCKVRERLEGDIMTAKDGSKWQLLVYPNGRHERFEGICNIYLQAIELGGNKEFLAVNYCFEVDEIKWKYDGGSIFYESLHGTDFDGFKLKQIEQLNGITIKCSIKPFIKQKNNDTLTRWTLNKHQLKIWKTVKQGDGFKGPLFYSDGIYYNLVIGPNHSGSTAIAIFYHKKGNEKDKIILCYSLQIEGTNYCVGNKHGKSVRKGGFVRCGTICSFAELQKMNSITIGCDVWQKKHTNHGKEFCFYGSIIFALISLMFAFFWNK
eukprot:423280_1